MVADRDALLADMCAWADEALASMSTAWVSAVQGWKAHQANWMCQLHKPTTQHPAAPDAPTIGLDDGRWVPYRRQLLLRQLMQLLRTSGLLFKVP